MDLRLHALNFSPFLVSTTSMAPKASITSSGFSSKAAQCLKIDDSRVTRRTADYMPSVWNYDFVQSLSSTSTKYMEEKYIYKANNMKDYVKGLIYKAMDSVAKLELIDIIQRLGLLYHFETDIKKILDLIHKDNTELRVKDDLYSTSLRFRLLRQHGYHVPQGETTINEAKIFSTTSLKNIKGNILSSLMERKIDHALDMPLHWRLTRLEARWFIDTYEQEQDKNPILLELAKLDYNMVQSVHRKEVGKLARWWVDTGLDKMSFSRDRLVEQYFWSSTMIFEPQYGDFRYMGTQVISFITTIDDIYDVYGSLDELELFTDFIDRWDMNDIDKLPGDIKTCLLAVYNTTNDIGYWTLKERGFNIIPYLSKMWANLCKAYLKEAKWYHSGYKPTTQEYLDNAVVSVGGSLAIFYTYFLTTKETINVEDLDYVYNFPNITQCSSMIVRLTNDLGTSSAELARGDTLKSIQCYMNETGASEEVAREYINNLVHETWKTLNKEFSRHVYSFSKPFIIGNVNMARTARCIFQYGDGHGVPDCWTKDHLETLLVQPVPLD